MVKIQNSINMLQKYCWLLLIKWMTAYHFLWLNPYQRSLRDSWTSGAVAWTPAYHLCECSHRSSGASHHSVNRKRNTKDQKDNRTYCSGERKGLRERKCHYDRWPPKTKESLVWIPKIHLFLKNCCRDYKPCRISQHFYSHWAHTQYSLSF